MPKASPQPETPASLMLAESHFRFGENWAEFARDIDSVKIQEAERNLARLLGRADLSGLTFLDIGSGSGLHSLAALRMGALRVTAVDIDADSVATTRTLLARHAAGMNWTAELRSVFELDPRNRGRFDIVYSWGVLHHTGAMFEAIQTAASLVDERGCLCIALYGRTALCGLWRREKRFYSRASKRQQLVLQRCYIGIYWSVQTARNLVRGRRFSLRDHAQEYSKYRGMNFYTDIHDWLGGYPYESASPDEVRRFVGGLGFVEERAFIQPGKRHGLLGTGCDEYVFRRAGK